MTTTGADVCAASSSRPHVVLVVAHCTMRALIVELLHRDHGCWTVSEIDSVSEIGHDASLHPDLVLVDIAGSKAGPYCPATGIRRGHRCVDAFQVP